MLRALETLCRSLCKGDCDGLLEGDIVSIYILIIASDGGVPLSSLWARGGEY